MKNPVGRPTLYRKEMCEQALLLLKEGASIEEIGLELDVGYTTIYEWMDKHPEFSQAIKKGREFSKGWWMKKGRVTLKDKDFNSTLWYMNMKNRHGWSDKTEVKNEDKVEVAIEVKDIENIRKSFEKEI